MWSKIITQAEVDAAKEAAEAEAMSATGTVHLTCISSSGRLANLT